MQPCNASDFRLLPDINCGFCPRLKAFIDGNRRLFPDKYNAPVPSFGDPAPALLIVGLAPGLRGANFSGRPFTGDYAGELLYGTLLQYGFAAGEYKAQKDDGLRLIKARVTNAVKCVPPENKPTTDEIRRCNGFLRQEIAAYPSIRAILCLGGVSHKATLMAFGLKQSAFLFRHGGKYPLPGGVTLFDSYHCSRYNTNTGRLTPEMFAQVVGRIRDALSIVT